MAEERDGTHVSVAPEPVTDAPQISRTRFWWALSGLLAIAALGALDNFIVNPALPHIVGEFGGLAHLSWVMTAFMLASTITMPLYGKFSDIHGRRALFGIAVFLFLLGSILCGMAGSMVQLIAFRGLQGLGAGGMQVLAMTSLGDLVSPRERPRYQGLFNTVFTLSSIAGPVIGGAVTSLFGWRWVFYINLPVGIVALLLIWFTFPRHAHVRRQHAIDYKGVILLFVSTVSLLLLLQIAEQPERLFSFQALLLVAASIAGVIWLIPVERRAAEPILAVHLAGNMVVMRTIVTSSTIGLAFFGSSVFFPLYFQMVGQHGAASSGLMLLPQLLGGTCMSLLGGQIVSRSGRYKPLMIAGVALVAVAFFALAAVARYSLGDIPAMACLALMGAGGGLCMPNMTVALQNAIDRRDMGVGTSSLQFCNQLAAVAGVALSGLLLAQQVRADASALLPPDVVEHVLSQGVQVIHQLSLTDSRIVSTIYRYAFSLIFMASGLLALLSLKFAMHIPAISLDDRTAEDITADPAP